MGNSPSEAFDPNQNGFNDVFDPNKNGVANAFDPINIDNTLKMLLIQIKTG